MTFIAKITNFIGAVKPNTVINVYLLLRKFARSVFPFAKKIPLIWLSGK
ncbi:hypothetical protein NSB1T_14410 [Coprobacter fastidiosus NSB1 = JCM 33896]|nr:hypothetical protein NSB1T_14410 [Coprobacter fastidiosus NSB1 = JCM 33896]